MLLSRPVYRFPRSLLFALALFALTPPLSAAAEQATSQPSAAAIASAHPLASDAGSTILEAGGNAFDAAVAVSAALAVVEPYSSGIGGGGFYLLHRAEDGQQVMVDGRERAPGTAHREMYLDELGEPIPRASVDGPLAAGIPGLPAALVHLCEHYGRLPLEQSLAPAIQLARAGFPIDPHYRRLARFRLDALRASPAAAAQFLVDGEVPELGVWLRQPDLATTLERLAHAGHDGFYRGPVAAALVDGGRAAGGIWRLEDLANYRVVEREPIRFSYRDHTIVSAAPPSSGGLVLAIALNILEGYPLPNLSATTQRHLTVEAMRRAYRDRARYLGDSDFVSIPTERLLSKRYAAGLRAAIHPQRALPSSLLSSRPFESEGRDTTHLSILDAEGNRVAATLSINYPFGAGFVPPGTGVLLNNEMDDFSIKPGVPNLYGLVGAEANAIAPGKRMLSSMSPTFIEGPERTLLLGTPGGSRIISMVLLAIRAAVEGCAAAPCSAEQLVALPRYHHQYLPDRIEVESGALDAAARRELEASGHQIEERNRWGNMQVVIWNHAEGSVEAAADPRGIGAVQYLPAQASSGAIEVDQR